MRPDNHYKPVGALAKVSSFLWAARSASYCPVGTFSVLLVKSLAISLLTTLRAGDLAWMAKERHSAGNRDICDCMNVERCELQKTCSVHREFYGELKLVLWICVLWKSSHHEIHGYCANAVETKVLY